MNLTGSGSAAKTPASIGKSFSVSCSCKLIVCVETMAFFFCATANKIAGIKYASDLPTPVPASTARCSRFCSARATATAISCCCGRNSKLLALERMPLGEKISSTCCTRSIAAPIGPFSITEIILKFQFCRIRPFALFSFPMSNRINYRTAAPETYQALLGVHQHIAKVFTDAKLRALIELRVSQINGCAFCLDMHSNEARHLGENQQRLDYVAAWREAPFFSERERAALAWAESLTRVAETHAPDEIYNEVKKHFSEKELVDLTAAIGMINLWNRMSVAFRSEPKERK